LFYVFQIACDSIINFLALPNVIMSCSPEAFIVKHYTILTSLNSRTIYLKLTDTIGYICYETHLEASDFHLSLPVESVYQLITQCFAEDIGYSADIGISGKTMTIRFRARVNNYIFFDFQINIKEKTISSDGQLTLNFNRIEERLDQVERKASEMMMSVERQTTETMTEVERRTTQLYSILESRMARVEACLANAEIAIRLNSSVVPFSISALSVPADNYLRLEKIQYLYNLQRISFAPMSLPDLSGCVCPTVKELYLDGGGTTNFQSIAGIELMPNLESLTIMNAPGLTQISDMLPMTHKIKYLRIKGCAGINMDGLTIYCRVNHIGLTRT